MKTKKTQAQIKAKVLSKADAQAKAKAIAKAKAEAVKAEAKAKAKAKAEADASALCAAIDAVVGMYGKVTSAMDQAVNALFDKSAKNTALKAFADYVRPGTDGDYERFERVKRGVREVLHAATMGDAKARQLADTLRNFRDKLGVKARETKKRTPAQKAAAAAKAKAAAAEKAEDNADDNIGKTAQERLLYAANWIQRFMAETGWNADETLSFFGKAIDQIAKRNVA
jgi:colicin import membrane protein